MTTLNRIPIASRFLPSDEQGMVFMAFRTQLGDKLIFTGIGIGEIIDGTPRLSPVGLRAYHAFSIPSPDPIFLCECRNEATARPRVIAALENAEAGAGVFVLCKNTEIYDAVLITELIGVTRSP